MKSGKTQILISVLFLAIGFGLIFVLTNYIVLNRPPLPEGFVDQDLMLQGAKLKDYSLGFNGLIADWYWMQSLQYVGGKIATSQENTVNIGDLRSLNPRLLYPLLDNATSLDPRYIAAYSYGAIVLPAIDVEQAIKITEKGIANNPNEWRLYQYLGYIYWRSKQYEKAGEVYERGSQISGAPMFMKMMTAQMKSQGGSRTTARAIYEQMYAEAQDTQTKETALIYLMQVDSLEERDAVNLILKNIKDKSGRCATNWNEVLPLLKNVQLSNGRDFQIDNNFNLVDPSGKPYILNQNSCTIQLDTKNSKIPAVE